VLEWFGHSAHADALLDLATPLCLGPDRQTALPVCSPPPTTSTITAKRRPRPHEHHDRPAARQSTQTLVNFFKLTFFFLFFLYHSEHERKRRENASTITALESHPPPRSHSTLTHKTRRPAMRRPPRPAQTDRSLPRETRARTHPSAAPCAPFANLHGYTVLV
jgi:hypothetical protein